MKKRLFFVALCIVYVTVLISCGKKIKSSTLEETDVLTHTEQTEPKATNIYNAETEELPEQTQTLPEDVWETAVETMAETVAETEDGDTNAEKLGYVAPEGWYSLRYEAGSVSGGDYKLKNGVMGLKVYYVEKKLGLRPYTWGYYTEKLEGEVAFFQSRNGLEYTGNVDLKTWLKMGFTESEWNNLGTYVSPVMITPQSTREEIVDVFISRAKEYLKTPYVVGASGKPGEGVDCSGLVLQCMYAIGVYPDGLDPVQHSTIEEYNSRLMWADPKLKRVSVSELLPGDLVFYRRPWSGSVCHVAIYLGDNECIEALYSDVEILTLYKDDVDYTIIGCKRIIAA